MADGFQDLRRHGMGIPRAELPGADEAGDELVYNTLRLYQGGVADQAVEILVALIIHIPFIYFRIVGPVDPPAGIYLQQPFEVYYIYIPGGYFYHFPVILKKR